jgi:hypothetical protein
MNRCSYGGLLDLGFLFGRSETLLLLASNVDLQFMIASQRLLYCDVGPCPRYGDNGTKYREYRAF